MARRLPFAMAALLVCVAACDAPRQHKDGIVEGDGVVRIGGVPISASLDDIEVEQADLIRFAVENVPNPLPREAVSLVKLLSKGRQTADGLRVGIPSSGILTTRLIVAAPGSNSLDLNILCLRNFLQIPCAKAARVWHVILQASTLARVPVEMKVVDGDRLNFLFIVEGDQRRPEPATTELHAVAGTGKPSSGRAIAHASHAAVFTGCDFATVSPDLMPRSIFRRPGVQALENRLYLVVQPPCGSGANVEIVRAVGVINSTVAVPFPGLDVPRKLAGPALVEQVPSELKRAAGTRLQVVVFRERGGAWITHPVTFAA